MHGYVSEVEFLEEIAGVIAFYYACVALMNASVAVYQWATGRYCRFLRIHLIGSVGTAQMWLLAALAFGYLAYVSWAGNVASLSIPQSVRAGVNQLMDPLVFCGGTLSLLLVLFWLRRFFVKPFVAWSLLNLALLFVGLSLTDMNFARIVTKPDNVAIVSMLFLLGFFTWLGAYRAVQNDDRAAQGQEPLESLDREKVLVWPDLVYIELICMVFLTAVLIFWAIAIEAPLEEPASSVNTPNPSKAPWYFVGLQEMLYYYDPWMAGVILPGLIIFGLMAIPYLDDNPKGNGYYTINERKFAYLTFQFGFLVLWILLIVMGTFLRGPNWTFFGIYETWDVHKVQPQININLSQYFWVEWLGVGLPRASGDANGLTKFVYALWREAPGIVLLILYFVVLPLVLATSSKFWRRMYQRLGFVRYALVSLLLLVMLLLPIKMVARWTIDLHYFVAIPGFLTF